MAKKSKQKKREYNKENLLYFQRKYLIPKLRQLTRYWPYNNIVRNSAKIRVKVGIYKNGKPKYEIKYKCNHCGELFNKIAIDHINPVVPVNNDIIDWGDYINGLFCDTTNLQGLCNYPGVINGRKSCHAIKAEKERKTRQKHKIRKNNMSN